MELDWVSAWASLGAALGTVATLAVAISVLRVEQRERARQEIRRVRCWLDLLPVEDLSPDELSDPEIASNSMLKPVAVAENATDELIYDVHLWVVGHGFRAPYASSSDRVRPEGRLQMGHAPKLTRREAYLSPRAGSYGAEMLFTDGRGRRWHRSRLGRLAPVHSPRPWAPWRVIPPMDWRGNDVLPWWAVGTRWRYRKDRIIRYVETDARKPFGAFRE